MWFIQSEDKSSTFQSTQANNQFWNLFFNSLQNLPFMTQGKTPAFLNWKVKGLTSDRSAHVAHPFFLNSESSLKKPLKMNWKKKWKQSLKYTSLIAILNLLLVVNQILFLPNRFGSSKCIFACQNYFWTCLFHSKNYVKVMVWTSDTIFGI